MNSRKIFNSELLNRQELSLVLFMKEWNGSSQIVSMIYDDLAKPYKGKAHFYRIDLDKEPDSGNIYGIREVPAILFFQKGRMIDHVIGLVAKNELVTKIELALKDHNHQ